MVYYLLLRKKNTYRQGLPETDITLGFLQAPERQQEPAAQCKILEVVTIFSVSVKWCPRLMQPRNLVRNQARNRTCQLQDLFSVLLTSQAHSDGL